MRRRRVILATLALLLLGGVIGMIWWLSRDIEAEDNKLSVPTLSAMTDAASTTSIEDYHIYRIDEEQTRLNFSMESDLADINGSFEVVGRWLEFYPDDNGWRLVIVLDIDGRTVDTGQSFLDQVIVMGFQAEKYPIGRFVGVSDEVITDLSEPHVLNAVGSLELSGVIQEVTIPIQFQIIDDQFTGNARMQIDAEDFGVEFASAIGSSILDAKLRVIAYEATGSIETIIEEIDSLIAQQTE